MGKGRWLHPKAETEGLFVSVELCVLFTGSFTASRFRRTGGFRCAFSRAATQGGPYNINGSLAGSRRGGPAWPPVCRSEKQAVILRRFAAEDDIFFFTILALDLKEC